MSSNGRAIRAALTPGHFLFTSESVGEGHPGMCGAPLLDICLISPQTKFVTRCPMPL